MDILVTMNDGSQFLAHHGVIGQKWGVWNDETKAKYGYGGNSAKGDRLRKKAAKHRAAADHARTNTAFVDRAARTHTGEITKNFAAANAHLTKGRAHKTMAEGLRGEAAAEKLAGNERKAKRLEKKAAKQDAKADRERVKEEQASAKGKMAANRFEREQEARQELAKEASKHDSKAAKFEKKAEKADIRMERKSAAQLDKLRSTAHEIASDKTGTKESRGRLHDQALNFLVKSNDSATAQWTKVVFQNIKSDANVQKRMAYESRMKSVMQTSLKEAGLHTKQADKVISDLLNDIAESNANSGMKWGSAK